VKRIVLADDSKTALMFIRRCLEIIGLQDAAFVEAANGKEALARLKEAPTDLLVTDLNMPEMDGATLLRWVKANPRLNEIPVLVITSASNPAKAAELLELGAFAVLDKPINPGVLLQALGPFIAGEGI
jgi:two-component system chemotaxis response regulator CheY